MATLQSPLMMTPVVGELISPSTHRLPCITTPCSVVPPRQLAEQDDANERKERRRSRLLEMQRRNLGSPATPTDKRKSLTTPSAGLTNAQLADHYTNCIKLSAENKINAKNAFGLHLIDYLSELLKKKEMNNFQIASSTLDASAKIYAGRVDAIHTETYKVLTGLGRSSDRRESQGGGDEEMMDGDQPEGDVKDAQKNKKRRRKKATVEANLKNINVKKVELEFEVDPLFQKTSATFDEGGSGGLLLNHLGCLDDTSAIAVDLNTVAAAEAEALASQRKPTDISDLRELYSGMALDALRICPEFADFSFTNWSREEEGDKSIISKMAKETDRRFDMEAEVEEVTMAAPDDDDDGGFGLPMDDFTGNDDDAPPENDLMINHLAAGDTVITLGNNKEAQLVESAMNDLTHGSVGSLMSVLASEPSEYSYFSTNILQSWAGPEHWKLKPKSKDEKLADKDGDKKDAKKSRKRKEPCILTAEDIEAATIEKSFKETRAATTLTMRTLTKNSKSSTTLPEDLQYEAQDLLKLATKPKVMVRLLNTGTDDVDDGVENYDYSNDNDKENFVPDLQGGDDDDMGDDGDHGAFDFSAGDVFSQSQDPGTQPSQNDDPNMTVFRGDNLLQQPHKVAKIDIGYAKTAKKVDVKRLKKSMWSLLCTEPDTPKAAEDKNSNEEQPKEKDEKNKTPADGSGDAGKTSVAGEHKFSELVKDLPNTISKTMAANLSVPIAFVCLLHLANEKTLKIESDADMSDLRITQGLKQLLSISE